MISTSRKRVIYPNKISTSSTSVHGCWWTDPTELANGSTSSSVGNSELQHLLTCIIHANIKFLYSIIALNELLPTIDHRHDSITRNEDHYCQLVSVHKRNMVQSYSSYRIIDHVGPAGSRESVPTTSLAPAGSFKKSTRILFAGLLLAYEHPTNYIMWRNFAFTHATLTFMIACDNELKWTELAKIRTLFSIIWSAPLLGCK